MKPARHIDNANALRPHGPGEGSRACGGFDLSTDARRELPALHD